MFEYHTYLHHSQTTIEVSVATWSLSTIHIYIILKPTTDFSFPSARLSTIHIYIILKLSWLHDEVKLV